LRESEFFRGAVGKPDRGSVPPCLRVLDDAVSWTVAAVLFGGSGVCIAPAAFMLIGSIYSDPSLYHVNHGWQPSSMCKAPDRWYDRLLVPSLLQPYTSNLRTYSVECVCVLLLCHHPVLRTYRTQTWPFEPWPQCFRSVRIGHLLHVEITAVELFILCDWLSCKEGDRRASILPPPFNVWVATMVEQRQMR
jgi:hypothetical protein